MTAHADFWNPTAIRPKPLSDERLRPTPDQIVCGNAEVREGASLKEVQVAAGVTVEANAQHKNEAITASGEDMDED